MCVFCLHFSYCTGACKFLRSKEPSCTGGGCHFVECIDATCEGGSCNFENPQNSLKYGYCNGNEYVAYIYDYLTHILVVTIIMNIFVCTYLLTNR